MNERDNDVVKINELIAQYYRSLLWGTNGQKGMELLKKFGLTAETIQKFDLGYAGEEDDSVLMYLKELGYNEADIAKSGILSRESNRELFRDRIIFPIKNERKQVVDFVGRTTVGDQPIYISSSSDCNLYGIEYAQESKAPYLIVCEGWIDTLLLHQAGFNMTVGYIGASSPLNLLYNMRKDVVLTSDHLFFNRPYDGVAMRAFYRNKCKVNILDLSPYSDSADFIMNEGADALKERIQNSKCIHLLEQNKDPDLHGGPV